MIKFINTQKIIEFNVEIYSVWKEFSFCFREKKTLKIIDSVCFKNV